jgi:lipopolysaccharide/colanic/teichoic acid biosynthesis glycosyltransferase
VAKRALDLMLSTLGLLVLTPVLLLVAILIKVDSPGPVFYRQVRVGRGGEPFRILKLRTMHVDADRVGGALTVRADPRVTRVGRWLRKLKLDELPQLANVVAGQMSIVGPRPEVPRYVERYTPEQRRVLSVRPGITDLASLAFRDENELLSASDDPERLYLDEILPRKLELSLEYVDRQNLVEDLRIMWRTVARVWLARDGNPPSTSPL